MNKGYRLSYDEDTVYFRPDGLTWKLRYREEWKLPYRDIETIVAERGQSNMQPFEYISLWRTNWDGYEEIFVSRIFLKDEEMREFLRFMHSKIPKKIPDEVIEYFNVPVPYIES